LTIVGTATLPTIGASGDPELQMGTGAVVAPSRFSAGELDQQGSAVAGPNAIFVTVSSRVPRAVALASLERIDRELSRPSAPDPPPSGVVSVLRPAEITDYRTVGSTAFLLAGALALGALGGLGLTLVASVRRRRHELSLLKSLGFTQAQLASTVAWQASVIALAAVLFGIPIGVALGRWLWTRFARGIFAVPAPTVPVWSVVLIGAATFVFANLVAAGPGRIAARSPTALVLQSE
jgi:predicted lysophospholipase L1 biosynthesis ABC-type transport system permease subunit